MALGEILSPEVVGTTASLGLLLAPIIGMAFSKAQREYILDRDQHTCQAPFKHRCCGGKEKPVEERKLQVHHVIPQRYCEEVGIQNPDTEDNGITLCKNSHIGAEGVHPDIAGAHSREDFKAVFEARDQKLRNHQIYWRDTWDRLFHVIIKKNAERFAASGRIFPPKRQSVQLTKKG